VIRVDNKEKVGGGGVLNGEGGLHISSSTISLKQFLHTVI
jgi:hypothetical protein